MAVLKFAVGDTVRFIGADTPLTVRQYNPKTREYRLQDGDDLTSSQWALEVYLEPA
jgi:hypothetical protein